jgi:cytoskeletal protein RodZ
MKKAWMIIGAIAVLIIFGFIFLSGNNSPNNQANQDAEESQTSIIEQNEPSSIDSVSAEEFESLDTSDDVFNEIDESLLYID